MTVFTVLGSTGFIGSNLLASFESQSMDYFAPGRDEPLPSAPLGHILYCIGLTADFRQKPSETVDAHVCKLRYVLDNCRFESLTYLSSTRVYRSRPAPVQEDDALFVSPSDPDDLYNLSKLMGESMVLSSGRPVHVVRLSNVYGPDFHSDSFFSAIIKEAVTEGTISLRTSVQSERDYISIKDVVEMLPRLAVSGTSPIYNLASGRNVTNGDLVEQVAARTGAEVRVEADAPVVRFPAISVDRIRKEFVFSARRVEAELDEVLTAYASHLTSRR